jgi:hypothetical protein
VASLVIIEPGVSVMRKDKDEFKPATDGQRLRVGDSIQTDATGFAQIDYTEGSFTRLDVKTTFTIVSLTDDEGNRQINGSLETGRTWNRTSALTESESFEQEGAGATAAVVGTAFMVSCTTPENCTFTSVVDGVQLTTVDGELQQLDPLEECDSTEIDETDAELCGAPSQVTLDAIIANQWIVENLFFDGLAGFEGIVVVEDGQVVSVTPIPPAGEPAAAGPTADPPVVDANPVNVQSLGDDPTLGESTGPNTEVVSQDERDNVTFVLQVENSGHTFWIVFTDRPDGGFGLIRDSQGAPIVLVTEDPDRQYDPSGVYTFDPVQIEPSCGSGESFATCFSGYPTLPVEGPVSGSVQWFDDFKFKAVNDQGDESAETTVTLVAVDDMCTTPGNPEEHDQDAIDSVPSCNEGGV